MGSSYTEYRGQGFWAKDESVEVWLHLMTEAIERLPAPEPWLREAFEDWRPFATAGFVGCIEPSLDNHCPDEARRLMMLSVANDAFEILGGFGKWINAAELGRRRISNMDTRQWEDHFLRYPTPTSGLDGEKIRRFGRAFAQLLEGTWRGQPEDTWVT